jgi:hypothetical protein
MAISLDFETFYSTKLKYSLKRMIAEQYVRHESFDAYMLAVCDGRNQWAGHPRDFNWAALDGQELLSHNRYFDNTVYNELVRRGWVPQVKYSNWHCTANMTAYLCNRRALDNAVEFLYKIKLSKAARADADGKHWPNDFSESDREGMLKYAPLDAYWCHKLWADHSHKWPEVERRLSNMTIEQGMRGVQINVELLNDYIVQSHEMLKNTENVIPWIRDADDEAWEEFNAKPTSTKCIAEQCRLSGIPCPPVKADEGEEAYEEWANTYSRNNPWIRALGSWRSVNKLYKSFLLVKERLRSDGTMPFGLKYFGAHTGRWAGSEKINMQNPRKKPVLCNQSGLMETSEPVIDKALEAKDETGKYPDWVKYSIDFRALIIPRPGTKMITCDLAAIEPRVLAWVTGNKAEMEAISGGMSVYEAFARTSMGYTGGKMDKRSDYYKLIKIMKLGLGYQAGWEKFIVIAQDQGGIDITKDDPEWIEVETIDGIKQVSGYGKKSREIVANFREKSPLLASRDADRPGLWERLDGAFKRSVGDTFEMTLPSGRKMCYRDVRASVTIEQRDGKPNRKWVYTAESDGRRKVYYGGKLCENLVQATARDVFGEHLVALEEAGHRVLFTAHDEAILECSLETTAKQVEEIMSVCPKWLPGCPIAAEAKEVAHYCK